MPPSATPDLWQTISYYVNMLRTLIHVTRRLQIGKHDNMPPSATPDHNVIKEITFSYLPPIARQLASDPL